MPYAEIKGYMCEHMVLRGLWRGNQQGCPEEGSPQRPHGWGDGPSLGTVYSLCRDSSAEKYWETRGTKDIKNYTPSEFRGSTGDELNGHLAANARMGRFIHAGGASTIKELTAYASVTNATLVDMEDGDAGTPIYVRTSKSSVSTTGSPAVSTNNGVTTYSFPGGTYNASSIKTIDRSQWENYGNAQGATSVIKRLTSVGTKVNRPANPTKITKMTFTFPTAIKAGTSVSVTLSNFGYYNVYDCTTWADYYTYPSYDYVGYFASSGAAGGGGTVLVTPEIVRAQKIKQGVLTQATTRDLKYDYFTYIPSAAEESSGTFLVQGASTAVQNFSFDGMDDIE